MTPKIVLASSSKYRKALLDTVFSQVKSIAPDIDERAVDTKDPLKLAMQLANIKARTVAKQLQQTDCIIIGSDQVASCDGALLHKPGNAENNRKQLEACSGKQVVFHTAICVIDSGTNTTLEEFDTTTVKFRTLSEQQINNYVSREPSYDCAGGFKVEGLGITLFEEVDSNDPNTLIGLPMIKLCTLLDKIGIHAL